MHRHYFHALDSWRGIAALLVAIHHFTTTGTITNSFVARSSGEMVDFFFLLSGFIIAANYRTKLASYESLKTFMLLRLGRVYPLHVVVLLLWLSAELAGAMTGALSAQVGRAPFSQAFELKSFFTSLFLVQSFGFDVLVWNTVAWSISTEVWTYLIFALILARGAPLDRSAAILVFAAAAILIYRVVVPEFPDALLPMTRCIYGFMAGVLMQSAYQAVTRDLGGYLASRSDRFFTYAEMAACVIAAAVIASDESRIRFLWIVPAFLPVIFIFAFNRGAVSGLLCRRPFVHLGVISYSIYMLHTFIQVRLMKPVLLLIQKWTGLSLFTTGADGHLLFGSSNIPGDVLTVLMLVCVVLAASLSYVWIERPARDRVRAYVLNMPRRNTSRPGVLDRAVTDPQVADLRNDRDWTFDDRHPQDRPSPARP